MHIKTIGYVCHADPFNDRKDWSGTTYKLREAIEMAGFHVVWIPYRKDTLLVLLARIRRKIVDLFSKGCYMGDVYYGPISKAYADSIDRSLIAQCDLLFFPGGEQIGLYLNTNKPFIVFGDSTFPLMVGYQWKGLARKFIISAEELCKQASRKAICNIRASQWALDSVINDYQCPPERCFTLELGPNLDSKDITFTKPYQGGPLNILFSGVRWVNKGGEVAFETVRLLRERGLDARLTVVGPPKKPSAIADQDYVRFIGFLDKNSQEDYRRYIELYKQSHIFLLPTRMECAGVVFCEASAFGLPCYTYLTGGTGSYVVDGYNGRALPLSKGAEDFANTIISDLNSNRYTLYRSNALRHHREFLSWEAWGKRFAAIVSDLR